MLDNRYALLFIRGERPVLDEKYDILKHPNVVLTADGSAPPYAHGGTPLAVASLAWTDDIAPADALEADADTVAYELLCEEELEEIYEL